MKQNESTQFLLFHEDIYEALKICVQAVGGPKKAGVDLWGASQPPNKLGEKVNQCLNPEHAQKFSLDELMWLLSAAQAVGCHAGINFICQTAGYAAPQPVEPKDEAAQLHKQFLGGVSELKSMLKRLEALEPKLRANQ